MNTVSFFTPTVYTYTRKVEEQKEHMTTSKTNILERLDQHTRRTKIENKEHEIEWLLSDDVRAYVERDGTIALYLNALFRCLTSTKQLTKLTRVSSILYDELKKLSNESRPLVLFRIISWGTRVSGQRAEDRTSTFNQIVQGYRDHKQLCLNMDLFAFSSPSLFFLEIWRRYGVSRNESELFRDLMTRYARVGFRRGHESHIVNALKAFLKELSHVSDLKLQQRKGKILCENLESMMCSSNDIWQHRASNHLLRYLTMHAPIVSDAPFVAFVLPILEVCCKHVTATSVSNILIEELKRRFENGMTQRREYVLRGQLPNPKDLSTNPEMLHRIKKVLSVFSVSVVVVQESHVRPKNQFQDLVYLIEACLKVESPQNKKFVEAIAASTSSLCDMTLHCALMIPAMSIHESDRFCREILPDVARIQMSNVRSEDVLIRSLVLLLKQSTAATTNSRSAIESVLCAYVRGVRAREYQKYFHFFFSNSVTQELSFNPSYRKKITLLRKINVPMHTRF